MLKSILYKNKYIAIGSLAIMMPFLFFAILAIFSFEYAGFTESASYAITLIFFDFLFISLYCARLMTRKQVLLTEIIFLLVLLLFIIYVVILFFSYNSFDEVFLYQFLIFIIPSALFALDLGRSRSIETIGRNLFFLSQVILASILFVLPKMLSIDLNDLSTFYGGGHYQGFAYAVSFSYLVNLVYFLFYLQNHSKLNSFYFILSFVVHASGVAFSGARGGAMVIIVGTLVCMYLKYSVIRFTYIIVKIFALLAVLFSGLLLYLNSYADRILDSVQRLFSYIGEDGLDMSKTSNRDLLYDESMRLIYQKPVLGYGIFDYKVQTGDWYPHNFFLEILLQGGMIYLFVWLLILLFFFLKLYFLLKGSNKHYFILPFLMYSFIQLLVSGSYLLEPFFWYTIIYVFTATSTTKVNLTHIAIFKKV